MKKLLFLITAITVIAIVSCSKESNPTTNADNVPNKNPLQDTNSIHQGSDPKATHLFGSITGYILPYDAKVDFRIYNKKFLSKKYATDEDGFFRADSLVEGIYDLAIYCKPNYKDTVISDIIVKGNLVTNIGIIQLRE